MIITGVVAAWVWTLVIVRAVDLWGAIRRWSRQR
jgi:hypothetical protein